ncbi:MAG: [FeFe] hydrogenase H-cluster maturation GTPase HydF [Syntrophales bacterium]|jgi:[FeFe] hydrogenase H-cluster maturation GTPase HydF|nr:[FeFe] hydrogenase H-cluster maturation GTPase HydF [Syntrophales bacterium]
MDKTPKANRLHVAIFGRTNVGKSSLLNYILGQDIAITSPKPGTTTDIVEKAAELPPLGPVLFLDTAGLDDTSHLGPLRIQKTESVFHRADIILLVTEAGQWSHDEEAVLQEARQKKIPVIVVINKIDLIVPARSFLEKLKKSTGWVVPLSTQNETGRDGAIGLLTKYLAEAAPDNSTVSPSLLDGLLPRGGLALLITPIDLEAPKGRLILPEVQTIRNTLDHDAAALVVKENRLAAMLSNLNRLPDLVVCDSQVIRRVTSEVPHQVPCTTFSILFARQKGDLAAAAEGAAAIETLRPEDRILIAEACSHHPLQDDIGRVKIPRWLREYVGGDLTIDVSAGRDYPRDLTKYRLVIHCGGCMLNRREMLERIRKAREANVPITNYGMAISLTQGVIRRVLSPFPMVLQAFDQKRAILAPDNRDRPSESALS